MDLSKLSNEDLIKLKHNAIANQEYHLVSDIRQEELLRKIFIPYEKNYSVIIENELSNRVIFESGNINKVKSYYKKANLILSKWKNYYQGKFYTNKHRYIQLNETKIKIKVV